MTEPSNGAYVPPQIALCCPHCGRQHYAGPQRGRPRHLHVTFWSQQFRAEPEDMCHDCAAEFIGMVRIYIEAALEAASNAPSPPPVGEV